MKPLLPLIEKPKDMKHPIPFHYKLLLYKSWLGMLCFDLLCFHDFKNQRRASKGVYKVMVKMAQTHGVKPYDYSKLYALLILLASLILVAAFLWECFVRFYLECCG